MDRVSVLCLSLLLCSLSGAELQDNEIIGQRKASPEIVNVPEQPQPCPSDLHAVLREMSVKLAVLQTKLEQVQTLNQEQSIKLKDVDTLKLQQQEQAAKLKAQTIEVDTLKQQQQEQSAKLRELQTNEVNPMKEQLRGQAAELNSVKARTNVTEDHLKTLRRDKEAGQVAFSASLVTSGDITLGPFNTHTPVVFRRVVINIGNAYDPNTGFFIAPARGAYHFELHIFCHMDGSHGSGAYLVKNGGDVFCVYERQASAWGSSSNGATLLLEAGDVVFVRLRTHTRIYDDEHHYSTFSGHLLFPM